MLSTAAGQFRRSRHFWRRSINIYALSHRQMIGPAHYASSIAAKLTSCHRRRAAIRPPAADGGALKSPPPRRAIIDRLMKANAAVDVKPVNCRVRALGPVRTFNKNEHSRPHRAGDVENHCTVFAGLGVMAFMRPAAKRHHRLRAPESATSRIWLNRPPDRRRQHCAHLRCEESIGARWIISQQAKSRCHDDYERDRRHDAAETSR